MGNIEWLPIADMPAKMARAGTEVLLWAGDADVPEIGFREGRLWLNRDGATLHNVSHFAEINPPT